MFTGIVDEIGTIERVAHTSAGLELRVLSGYEELRPGESIAIDGVCLTVREHGASWFTVAAAGPTIDRTTIGEWPAGRRVNLERALRVGDRMSGHIVQGHVDGIAIIQRVDRTVDRWLVDLALPEALAELMVPLGSLTVNGVSLTVNALPAPGIVQISLVDYTLAHTTLASLRSGDRVHVECDVIGKYVQRLLVPYLLPEAR